MEAWIDFQKLRGALDFRRILEHYGVTVKAKGHQHYGKCPLPGHAGEKKSDSFSAHLGRGIFQCFRCKAKGNALEFAVLMEGSDPQNGKELRRVAEQVAKLCSLNLDRTASVSERAELQLFKDNRKVVVVNQALNFELKGLDANHRYLCDRGFTTSIINTFGLGFCSRGLLKNRIAIPLHDQNANLVGYAGRVIDEDAITESNPRYLFPGERTRENVNYAFRKSLFLYNGFRFKAPLEHLILVEGFASVWWLTQHEFGNVVATMGSDCSERQRELILAMVKKVGRISIIPDADEAGRKYAARLLERLSPHRFVRWVQLETGKQPTDLTGEELQSKIER